MRYNGSVGEAFYQPKAFWATDDVNVLYFKEKNGIALKMLLKEFPFKIQKIQTDNGTEFTYKYISDNEISPLDKVLQALKIPHILIPPRTPWHNGKVERSHRNDQRYFYNWETFKTLDELNEKLKKHLEWSNSKIMRTLGMKSPVQLLAEKLAA